MKKLKKLTSLSLALLIILNTFLPITVLALNTEGGIVLTFSLHPNHEGHSIREQEGHLVIDNNYVDPNGLTIESYVVACNDSVCTMSFDNTIESVKLDIDGMDAFSLRAQGQVIDSNTTFTNSDNISVEHYFNPNPGPNPGQNPEPDGPLEYDETKLSLTITLNMADNAPENFEYFTNSSFTSIGVTDGQETSYIGLDRNDHSEVAFEDVQVTLSNNNKTATVKIYNNDQGIFMTTPGDSIFKIDDYFGAYEIITQNGTYTTSVWEHEPPFDGNILFIWQCGDKACKKEIHLENPQEMTYIKDSTITDGTNVFNLKEALNNINNIGYVFPYRLEEWETQYKIDNNLTDQQYDFKNIDVELLLNGRIDQIRRQYFEDGTCEFTGIPGEFEQCVDEHAHPTIIDRGLGQLGTGQQIGASSYTSFGDNVFKITIYSEDYVAIREDETNLKYKINRFETMYTDSKDITGSTKTNPVVMETLLMEGKTTISSNNIEGVQFKSVKPLDVPEGAIDITDLGNGKFEIKFNSNFFDRTIFEITDTNNNIYYVRIVRKVLDASFHYNNPIINKNNPHLEVMLSFDNQTSWNDYEVNATLIMKDGSYKKSTLENLGAIDIGGGNVYYVDHMEGGTNFDIASFGLDLTEADLNSIEGVYVNVRKTGSTDENYAGTYAGNGRGIYIGFDDHGNPIVDYSK